MLGDNAEKSKNPLKKAMRRRNAKTVTFASPTYFEPSSVDYSTDEEQDDDQFFEDEDETARSDAQDTQDENQSDNLAVEPLRPKSQPDKDALMSNEEGESELRVSPEKPETGDDSHDKQSMFDLRLSMTPSPLMGKADDTVLGRSRNGVVRNTDSFFKDDTVETKKISLTPNLLRDDANSSSVTSDPKEVVILSLKVSSTARLTCQSLGEESWKF
jgi:hypothetical protein